MNKIKKSIEDELKDLKVDDGLKFSTLNKIKRQEEAKLIRFNPRYYLKALTLVSTFIIVLAFGINTLYQGNPASSSEMRQYDLFEFAPKNNSINNEAIRDSDDSNNQPEESTDDSEEEDEGNQTTNPN
jgi:hypothetical protein